MKPISAFFLALVVGSALTEVVDLSKKTYKSTIEENEFTVVMYHLHFNKLCRDSFPKFKKLSNQLESATFARIDGEKYRKFTDSQGIDHFPSYELFIWGVPIKYPNSTSISGLRKWLKEKINSKAHSTLSKKSQIDQKDYQVLYVADEDSNTAKYMQGLSVKYPNISIHRVTQKLASQMAKQYGLTIDTKFNTIFAYRAHDKYHSVYEGDVTPLKLESWIVDNEYPDWSEFNDKTIHWFENEKLPMVFYFYDSSSAGDSTLDVVKDAGGQIKGTALTVIADTQRPEVLDFAQKHGLHSYPALVLYEHGEVTSRYRCRKKLSNLKKIHIYRCVEKFREGRLIPMQISEPLSAVEENTEGVVTYQVGLSFSKLFKSFKNYHLVFFYTSDTEEQLKKFITFANDLGKVKNFTFSMFNKEKNEHVDVNHLHSGTLILLKPKGSKVPQISFEEGFDEEKLMGFLEDNLPVKVYQSVVNKREGVNIDL